MSDQKKFRTGEAFKSYEEAMSAIQQSPIHLIRIGEDDRQMIILALAELSIIRPGWCETLNKTACKMDNVSEHGQAEMFEAFRQNHTLRLREALTR